jgi:excisionase family DNA binding protein
MNEPNATRRFAPPRDDPVDRTAGCLWTAADLADRLGVPVSWVYKQTRLGRIPTVTLGRYRRYRPEAIEAWLKRVEVNGGTAPEPRLGGPGRAGGSSAASVGR